MINFNHKTFQNYTGIPIHSSSFRLMSIFGHNHLGMLKIMFSLLMAEMHLRPKPRLVSGRHLKILLAPHLAALVSILHQNPQCHLPGVWWPACGDAWKLVEWLWNLERSKIFVLRRRNKAQKQWEESQSQGISRMGWGNLEQGKRWALHCRVNLPLVQNCKPFLQVSLHTKGNCEQMKPPKRGPSEPWGWIPVSCFPGLQAPSTSYYL